MKLLALRRRQARGVTLIEILVVLAIVALLAGGIAFGVLPQFEKAKISTTTQSAIALRAIVVTYRLDHADCPSIAVLRGSGLLDAVSKSVDAWEHPFEIACDDGGETRVRSAGPDGRLDSDDDIRAPSPPVTTATRRP